jgi:ribosomal protein S30
MFKYSYSKVVIGCSLLFLISILIAGRSAAVSPHDGPRKVLLEIANHNDYRDSPTALFWVDISENNYYVFQHGVPAKLVSGGIDFINPGSFLAVNDAFMSGLDNFILSFWFKARNDKPKGLNTDGNGGVLICSNWATGNNGDWLVGFGNDGSLKVLMQNPDLQLKSRTNNFHNKQKYAVRVEKTKNKLLLYIDGELQDSKEYLYSWPENGAPLAIGGNPYDRHGMGYFNGIIGGIKITTVP